MDNKQKQRTCIDCGRALVTNVRGRPALRCGECARGRRRIKERAEQVCIDCGAKFKPPGHTGRPPERCEACRAIRKREVDRAKARAWREANPERSREHWNKSNRKRLADPEFNRQRRDAALVRNYGITRDEFNARLAEQGGVCATCGGERNGAGKVFHVDHDHRTGKVRGLLCAKCNTAIGLLNDDPELAERIAAYLRT